MNSTIVLQTTVLPGNRIELTSPELQSGEVVQVMIVRPAESGNSERSSAAVLEIIESLQGYRHFQSGEEVANYLNQEREAWDR